MIYRTTIPVSAVAIILLTCSFLFSAENVFGTSLETRNDELFSVNFPRSKKDEFDMDYENIDTGERSIIPFEVVNDLASGQDFQLRLENVTSWFVTFPDSPDSMTMYVSGHNTSQSYIMVSTEEVGEKTIFINLSVGVKYVLKSLKFISLPAAITLSPTKNLALVDAGEGVIIDMTVQNNLADADSVSLSLSNNIVVGSAAQENTWIGEMSDDSVVIPGNDVVSVSITIFAPRSGVPNQKVIVAVTATSQNRDMEYTVSFEVRIRSIFEMYVSTDTVEKNVSPGGTAEFKIGIENTGNDDLKVNPQVLSIPENWSIIFIPMSKVVRPDTMETVTVRVETNPFSITGFGDIRINFTSPSGPWEKVAFKVFVNPVTDMSFERLSPLNEILYPGETEISSFRLTSDCNHDQAVDLSILNYTSSMEVCFSSIETGMSGTNSTRDLTNSLDLAGSVGIITPSPDQKVNELKLNLAPFQEITLNIISTLTAPPLLNESTADVVLEGVMGTVRDAIGVKYQLESARLRIISLKIGNEEVGNDGGIRLNEKSEYNLDVTLRNDLKVESTPTTISISIDGEDIDTEPVQSMGPNETKTVALSWKTKSISEDNEELLHVVIVDSYGREVASQWIEIQLMEHKEETRINFVYVIISFLFFAAIAGLLIYVIKSVKKKQDEKQEQKGKIDEDADEDIDDFFLSDRKTYYPDEDYVSMSSSSALPEEKNVEELYESTEYVRSPPGRKKGNGKRAEHARGKTRSGARRRRKPAGRKQ